MKIRRTSVLLAFVTAFVVAGPAFAGGSVVDYVEPKNQSNPPPAMPLNSFQRFEIMPIAMDAPYAGQSGNEAAKSSIQANLDLRAQPVLADWTSRPAGAEAQTLKIEPTIRHIRFTSGGARFWGGEWWAGQLY